MTFVPETPDKSLLEGLRAEQPGILEWAIEGCLEWQRIGLQPPKLVANATADYFAEQDAIARWIDERVDVSDTAARMPVRGAYADWAAWAKLADEFAGSEKRFSGEVERRFAKLKTRDGMVFVGAKLRPTDAGAW
jgi:putative DNA primase/helicase